MRAIAAYREVVNEALADFDELPGVDAAHRQALRSEVRRIVSRPRALRRYYTRLWMPYILLGLLIATAVLAVATHAWIELWGGGAGKSLAIGALCGPVFFFGAAGLAQGIGYFDAFVRPFFLSLILAYAAIMTTYPMTKEKSLVPVAGIALFSLSFIVVFTVFTAIVGMVRRGRPPLTNSIYAVAAAQMLEVASLVSQSCPEWRSRKDARYLISEIEQLARTCEDSLSLRSRIGMQHRDVFTETAVEALRIAHVVRQHKKIIACAASADDYERVAVSLSNGLHALLVNDRSKLLENAPDAVLKQRLKLIARHLFPVLLLTAAAIALPLVPPISDQAKIADSVRWTFIVAAVLALIAPRSDSSAKILDVLGKSMPSK
ncbi:hypothetical protein ABZ851_05570 [Streptomyces sp. NPDC047049]|uniref:hypothetical protein n=1 Tax=Streptomyces sp. NPDC047049 TaxID=3156688 RepID=UPI0034031285